MLLKYKTGKVILVSDMLFNIIPIMKIDNENQISCDILKMRVKQLLNIEIESNDLYINKFIMILKPQVAIFIRRKDTLYIMIPILEDAFESWLNINCDKCYDISLYKKKVDIKPLNIPELYWPLFQTVPDIDVEPCYNLFISRCSDPFSDINKTADAVNRYILMGSAQVRFLDSNYNILVDAYHKKIINIIVTDKFTLI